jgi:hypothetical protein
MYSVRFTIPANAKKHMRVAKDLANLLNGLYGNASVFTKEGHWRYMSVETSTEGFDQEDLQRFAEAAACDLGVDSSAVVYDILEFQPCRNCASS